MRKWTTLIIVLLLITLACGVTTAQSIADSRHPDDGARIEKAAVPGLITKNMSVAGMTKGALAAKIVGAGISYSNVTLKGVKWSSGFFSNGSKIIGISDGIILSSGDIEHVKGPNYSDSFSAYNYISGDPDLNALIPGYSTNDATVLEFDFVPKTNVIKIQYVFSSDEYNEFVDSSFNDVFGFFVNGKNIARLPDSANVTINNINLIRHSAYYRNNDYGDLSPGPYPVNTEMDGLTTVITSMVSVTPNKLNHMKIAIADATDYAWDSNVFIKVDSLTTYTGPVIYTIKPASKVLPATKLLVTANGDNFNKSISTFTLKRGTKALTITDVRYISRTKMTFNVTIPWSTPAGTWNLTVRNPDGKSYQATDIFTVRNPVPAITTISPASRLHGTGGFTLNVTVSNFVPASQIFFKNIARPTVYISPQKLSTEIPAAAVSVAGSTNVKVNNTAPGGGWSNAKTFTIT